MLLNENERGLLTLLGALIKRHGGDAYLTEKDLDGVEKGIVKIYFDQEQNAFHLVYIGGKGEEHGS